MTKRMQGSALAAAVALFGTVAFGGVVEYVESTGSQHFDTGIVPSSRTRVLLDFQYIVAPGSGVATSGWQSSGSQEVFAFGIDGGLFKAGVSGNNTWYNSDKGDTKRRVFDIASGSQKLGVVEGGKTNLTEFGKGVMTDTAESGQTIYLFARHGEWLKPDQVGNWFKMRVFGCQIYEDGMLVRDYVPYSQNKTFGFYDRVGGTFTGANPDTPLVGPTYRTLDFVEMNGTQCFDTGYVPTPKSRFVVDFQYLTASGSSGWQSSGSKDHVAFRINGNFAAAFSDKEDWRDAGVKGDTKRRVFDLQSGSQKLGVVEGGKTNLTEFAQSTYGNNLTDAWKTFYLGARHAEWKGKPYLCDSFSKIRFFGCRIYEDGTLVHDFVPCARNGQCGFLDRVAGVFKAALGGNLSTPGESVFERPYLDVAEGQFFDTGIVPTKDMRIVADFQYLSLPKSGVAAWSGWQATDHLDAFLFGIYNDQFATEVVQKESVQPTGVPADTARHVFDLASGSLKFGTVADGRTNLVEFSTSTYADAASAGQTFYLFARHAGWNVGAFANADKFCAMRLYSCQVYSGATLVRDFVPSVVDGRTGLYDRVAKSFYPAGLHAQPPTAPEVATEKLYYVETTGKQYFDTGVVAKPTTRIVADMRFLVNGIGHQMMGWAASNPGEAVLWGIHNDKYFGGYFDMGYSAPIAYSKREDTDRHVFDYRNGSQKIDGVEYATTTIECPLLPINTMYLFGRHSQWKTDIDWCCKSRMYGCQIYDGEELIRDYVPALADGRACLFDRLNGKPCFSTGPADFIAGTKSDKGMMVIVR